MADGKVGTSYRLSTHGLALINELSGRLGLSHAGVIELALRQTARWVDGVAPGGLAGDLADVRSVHPQPEGKGRGRPRKDRGKGEGEAS